MIKKMKRIIGIPSNGLDLSDKISEHFGHCNYFVGIELDEYNNFRKLFSLKNSGHVGCMEPVMNMKERNITEMIVSGIGGRPYIGFLDLGIRLYKGINGTLKKNIEFLLQGNLESITGPSCGNQSNHFHDF
jgi:predicted Fe-Mo cluster-binding NifX family protein